jgi:hypothetical protein
VASSVCEAACPAYARAGVAHLEPRSWRVSLGLVHRTLVVAVIRVHRARGRECAGRGSL